MAASNESTPTPDVIAAFDEALDILNSALNRKPYHPPKEQTADSELAVAILLHALSARDDARAVAVLAKASLGYSMVTHLRTIFEARVKMIWLTKDAKRAIHFLESEPFERYWLASKYPGIKKRPVWKSVLAACAEAVKSNPTLAKHQANSKASSRPDYLAIAKALRMPDMQDLLDAIDDGADTYTEDFLMNSLASHVSVVHLKDFPKGVNTDGSMLLDTTASREFVDFYLLKAIPWILQIIAMASVAFGTKDATMPILQDFNKRLDPLFERYNKPQES